MESRDVYEALSEIKERAARTEEKIDNLTENTKKIDLVRDIAKDADKKADLANHRLNSIDKWMFAVGSAAVLGLLGAAMNLIIG